jgi:CheY-like chemotaxis protein
MHKALIIDDDNLNLRLMSAMLAHLGYEVYTSQRGDHGVDLAQDIQPDLILIDLLMPKATYDGVKSVQVLRGLPQFQMTPIIAISAADSQTIQSLLLHGLFTDFIQKPITLDKLNQLLVRFDHPNTA